MDQRQRSPITHLRIVSVLAVLAVATLLADWGSGSARGAHPAYYPQVRDAVVRGVGRDFAAVPELTGAARGLAGTHATGASVRKLGVTYGPYLGLRCRPPVAKADCERIGIDIVLRRPARSVVAVAGDQKIHLRTPGRHDGVRAHDWVGTFTHAGIAPGSYKPGTNVTWVELELRVRFADGTRRHAAFPHVLLSPGWG
jgi:hypothetical protein